MATTAPPAGGTAFAGYGAKGYRAYVLTMMLLVYTFNFIDRTVVSIVQQPIKEEFGLTVLMAEQNFHEASRIADRGYVIVHGEIALHGANLQELQHSELVKSYYLGA